MTIDDVELWARRNNFTIVADEWWNDAQDIICKYRKIEQIVNGWSRYRKGLSSSEGDSVYMQKVSEVIQQKIDKLKEVES